ncbi:MAG TPA: 6-hydroxymethylpterin diphosphokinase MptE-like protein [Phycisphaerales bacterium]|nr:6-hydroxymethylpterin diphosphokinase MptE-like protein [Phycisphaerales bacterium]
MVANSTLDRNLGALLALNAGLARELAELEPADGLEWVATDEGEEAPSAIYKEEEGGAARSLASRRTPRAEGERWAAQADLTKHAVFVVRGFALGYHVGALARRAAGRGAVIVFEPDKRLLRAVLERVDCTEWIAGVAILTDADDRGAIVEVTNRIEPLIAMGTAVLDHPASLARLGRGNAAQRFMERFTAVVATVRVSIASTMVQTLVTLRNCLQNLDHYATCPGIESLRGAFAGRTAIVVSAGPSLQRNIDLLSRRGVADRFVIVAVQTVLRPLLDKGIRPHFVCALDYHEVSRRFYEGLTEEAVRGVTLVAEPKVNPSVPSAFPGKIRMVGDGFLDLVLGEGEGGLARPMGRLPAGTTVAHLCCYLARFLGCDPVCLIGQDLGFTDGQYYAAGASIHGVWGAELNEFKTLETMEWQRIVRHRPILRKETDHLGRPVYTDEQMHTYLTQFARDFRAEAQAGRTTIDATEGGVRKPGTVCRPLAEVIDEELARPAPAESVPAVLARVELGEGTREKAPTLKAVGDRLRHVRQGVWRIGELSRRAGGHLSEAAEHHKDQQRVNGLIAKLEGSRAQVRAIEPGWTAVQLLNQAGAFRRMRADRALSVEEGLDAMARQRRQIERDLKNVEWLAETADEMAGLLDGAAETLEGGERVTRDPPASAASLEGGVRVETAALKAVALVMLDTSASWWGTPRDPLAVRLQGRTALSLTLERLGRAERVGPIVVVTDDVDVARRAAEGTSAATLGRVIFEPVAVARAWPYAVARASRAMAAACWRGGLNDLTCYDEAFDAAAAAAVMERHGGGACGVVVCGPSWCCVDPAVVDAVVARHAEDRALHRVTFAHAAPGLGAAMVETRVLSDLANGRRGGGLWGSMGGLLGYSPVAPVADLIAKGACVTTNEAVRHTRVRATADTTAEAAWLEAALNAAGLDARTATAAQTAGAVNARAASPDAVLPLHAELRLTHGGETMPFALASAWISKMGARQVAGAAVTLRDSGLSHPRLFDLLAAAREVAGGALCVHVRTDLCVEPALVDRLCAAAPDVVSVDCHADMAEVYATLTGRGVGDFALLRSNLERLMNGRRSVEGVLRLPMVVPRLTRRDAVYGQIEDWYDRHLLACGWAVLDPLEAPVGGERIAPLPLPASARAREAASRVVVDPDGRVSHGGGA